MKTIYLVDTNIISELMRREPAASVLAWAEQQTEFFVSAITVEELLFGLTRKSLPMKQRWLEDFYAAHCQTLPITEKIARTAGILRGRMAAQGHVRPASDMLIAATALCHGLSLATRNLDDFASCGIELLNPFER